MAILDSIGQHINEKIKNKDLLQWIQESVELCEPDAVILIDGSDSQKIDLQKEALSTGELIELNQEKWPGCFYHRSALNDVARVEDKTFICTSKKDEAGPNNNWMAPQDAYKKAGEFFKGSMKGRTMYIIPFSMGTIGSPFS